MHIIQCPHCLQLSGFELDDVFRDVEVAFCEFCGRILDAEDDEDLMTEEDHKNTQDLSDIPF